MNGCISKTLSVYNFIFEEILLGMSLMKQRNNRGARTVPCGTPDDTVARSLYWPSTSYNLLYSIRNKAFIEVNKSPRIP